ncbi:MAG: CDP-diacylglycerol--glycerol-3-phosphate 3-phosphatidyltransferase [Candidatus Omnitrophota bacterium]
MNLPNKLTLSRIGLSFIFMFFLFLKWPYANLCALFAFFLASLTDYYDGKLARELKVVTDFGKLMDPVADKVLILSAFLSFVQLGIVPAWMVVIIILRELVITGMRITLLSKKKVIPAAKAGKHKTVSQMTSIFVVLIYLTITQLGEHIFSFNWWNAGIDYFMHEAIYIMMLVTVLLTLTSGIFFLKDNLKSLK